MTNTKESFQRGILAGVPSVGRYASFSLSADVDAGEVRNVLSGIFIDDDTVLGLGEPLVALLGGAISSLRSFPSFSGPGIEVPSIQHALWIWLRGDNQGDLVHRHNALRDMLNDAFHVAHVEDAFKFGGEDLGKDLTGYEDGTENPTGDDAIAAAIVAGEGTGLDGSSFVAVQQWQHDLPHFASYSETERDHIIGRRIADNTEIAGAPESAHVKRTEQESFDPEAHVVRRSMPFAGSCGEGLMFVAFGKSLDAFEVQMRRMAGQEDGITDALFRFSKPLNGAYYWCPPVSNGHLDLRALG